MKRGSLTRRQFLHRFGAISGSSMVFGAMDAWAMTGGTAGPKPRWGRGERNARVLVLGAGVSGMAVGWELTKLGYDVALLEARHRVGGVNHTVRRGTQQTEITGKHQVCDFDEGLYFNCGPWRIPNSHEALLGYCRELGVPLQVFINEHDAALLYYEGEEAGALRGKKVRMREVKADLRGHTSELLAKAVNQQVLDTPMTAEDTEMLVEYLAWEGYLDEDDMRYLGSEARGEGDPYSPHDLLKAGFSRRFRSIDAPGNTRAPMFQPIGGMDQIPMAFGRVLADRITLGAEVRKINQTEDGVSVVYRDTSTGDEYQLAADYVVSCIPLSVLRTIEVDLSPEMKAAVNGVNYSNSAKIGIQMKRRFWEEDEGIYGGASYTDLPLGQFAYPSNDFFTDKGILLGYYGSEGIAGLAEKSVKERLDHVVSHASRLHPQIAEEYETGFTCVWSQIPYSLGAFATNPRGLLEQLQKPDGRIYLGCAGASDNPGWMEGAFAAAWRTVDGVHRRVMG